MADGDSDEPCYRDNWPAFVLFVQMQTQWRVGFSGPIGLDYSALTDLVFAAAGIEEADRIARFEDLRVMEKAALEVFRRE